MVNRNKKMLTKNKEIHISCHFMLKSMCGINCSNIYFIHVDGCQMKIILEGEILNSLQLWLLSREEDIADGWEDFGELRSAFEKIIGWKARSVIE